MIQSVIMKMVRDQIFNFVHLLHFQEEEEDITQFILTRDDEVWEVKWFLSDFLIFLFMGMFTQTMK